VHHSSLKTSDPDHPSANETNESSLQPAVNHLVSGSDGNNQTWRNSDAAFDLSPQTFGVEATRDNISDDEDDAYEHDRFLYNFDMSDDQKQATSELYNLKLDLGFAAGRFLCVYLDSVHHENCRKLHCGKKN
jgi:hypothetical protein